MRIISTASRVEFEDLSRKMKYPATMNDRLVIALIGSAQKLASKRSQ